MGSAHHSRAHWPSFQQQQPLIYKQPQRLPENLHCPWTRRAGTRPATLGSSRLLSLLLPCHQPASLQRTEKQRFPPEATLRKPLTSTQAAPPSSWSLRKHSRHHGAKAGWTSELPAEPGPTGGQSDLVGQGWSQASVSEFVFNFTLHQSELRVHVDAYVCTGEDGGSYIHICQGLKSGMNPHLFPA